MDIKQFKEPFYHTIIYDFYTLDEEQLIWQEIDFLQPKLMDKNQNYDPKASLNKLGLPLDEVYGIRNISNILTVNRKIFNIWEELTDNPFAEYLSVVDRDFSFLSYYPDKSYYGQHTDVYIISTITTWWKTPKRFSGGDLNFTNYNYIPKMNHNTLVLFPSYQPHEVLPISIKKEDEIAGLSRYTINQFMRMEYLET